MDLSRFDLEELVDRVGGDREFALDLFRQWVDSLAEEVPAFSADVEVGDLSAARHRAHTLKGAALNLAAGVFAACAAEAEQAAEAGNGDAAISLAARLSEEAVLLNGIKEQLTG